MVSRLQLAQPRGKSSDCCAGGSHRVCWSHGRGCAELRVRALLPSRRVQHRGKNLCGSVLTPRLLTHHWAGRALTRTRTVACRERAATTSMSTTPPSTPVVRRTHIPNTRMRCCTSLTACVRRATSGPTLRSQHLAHLPASFRPQMTSTTTATSWWSQWATCFKACTKWKQRSSASPWATKSTTLRPRYGHARIIGVV